MNIQTTIAVLFVTALLSGQGVHRMAYPLGIRLNNPGDIKRTNTEWVGMSRYQEDKKFIRFDEPYYGIRAIIKILRAYKSVHGLDTIDTIIYRYAPPEDGNYTKTYIRDICEMTGYFPSEVLDLNDREILVRLAKAIVIREQGRAPAEFPEAWYEDYIYHNAADNVLKEERDEQNG